MAKRTCPQGHVTKDNKALKCSICGQDLPPAPKRSKLPIVLGIICFMFLCIIITIAANSKDNGQANTTKVSGQSAKTQQSTSQSSSTIKPTATPKPTKEPQAERTATLTATARPTNTPAPTLAPTDTPTFEETLRTAIEKEKPSQMDSFEHKYVPATDKTGASMTISYRTKLFWSVDSLLSDCTRSFLKTGATLYKLDPKLDTLTVQYLGEFTDVYGKKNEEPVLIMTVNRKTADKITWENVDPCNLPIILDDGFELHLSRDVRSAWAKNCD